MNIYKQTKTGNSQLLLVFSGWAASPEVFRQLETEPDTDLWICYDYRGMDFEGEALSGYRKIRLVAWSLGVWAASVVFGKKPVSFTEAIAVNGTPCPVHDQWGIPETIFRGTLDNVTEEGMRRFNRRMCGKRDILQAYEQIPPRPLADIREELEYLYAEIKKASPASALFNGWTQALISSKDRIFPTENLRAFWQGRCPITEIEAPHYPFYLWKQWDEAIETKQIHIRFTRALSSYDNHADAQHRISRKLASLLPHQANVRYKRMLEIGCGTGGFTGVLKQQCHIDEWILNDLCEDCQEKIEQLFPGSPPRFIAGDAETLSFPGKFDLIASASVFQWMKEPETFLHKLSGLLMQQGLLLFSTFVPGNLHEIKKLTGKGLVYPTSDTLVGWLSTADFNLLHQEEDTIVLTFKTPLDVLRHLKATGVTATGNGCWTKGRQESFCRQYVEQFATTDGQVTLTYRPFYILATKK